MKNFDAWMTPKRMLWASVVVALITIGLRIVPRLRSMPRP